MRTLPMFGNHEEINLHDKKKIAHRERLEQVPEETKDFYCYMLETPGNPPVKHCVPKKLSKTKIFETIENWVNRQDPKTKRNWALTKHNEIDKK